MKDWRSDHAPGTPAEARALVTKGLKRFGEEALRLLTGYEYLMSAWREVTA
ncbi:MAG: hypothetical protein NZ585_14670 [Chloracidobacterium sp.]|nr:hypothetical protein [Chloracidobacterium sp.]